METQTNKQGGIAEWAILIALVLSPLCIINPLHNTRFIPRVEYQLAFQTIVMVVLALSQPNKWIGAFFIWAIVNYYAFGLKPYGQKVGETLYVYGLIEPNTNMALNMIFFGEVFLLVCHRVIRRVDWVLKAIAISGIIVACTVIAHAIGLLPIKVAIGRYANNPFFIGRFVVDENHINIIGLPGIIGIPNITAAYLAICALIFLIYFHGPKIILSFRAFKVVIPGSIWGLGFIGYALFLTKGNWAIVSVACGFLFWMWVKSNRNWWHILYAFIGGTICSVGFCLFNKPSIPARLQAIKTIASKMTDWHIFTGYGLGMFKFLKVGHWVEVNGNERWMNNAHNEPFQCGYELGAIGLFIVLCCIAFLFYNFYRKWKQGCDEKTIIAMTCFVVFLVNSIANFTLHHALTAVLGLVLFDLVQKSVQMEGGLKA